MTTHSFFFPICKTDDNGHFWTGSKETIYSYEGTTLVEKKVVEHWYTEMFSE